MSVTNDGIKIPDEILIGMEKGRWPMRFFYSNGAEREAAEWLGAEDADPSYPRRVYRATLTPTCEVRRVPPVPATTEDVPLKMWPQ